MVGTIIPMVYGKRPIRNLSPLLVIHTLASTAGGLSVGLLLGLLSILASYGTCRLSLLSVGSLIGVVAIVYSLKEAQLVSVPVLQSRWQVPRRWGASNTETVAACLYGFVLGMGLFTRLSSCLYPVLVWSMLQAHPAMSVLVMSIFGVCRTIPLWVIYLTAEGDDTEYPRLCISSLGQWQPAVFLFNALALVFVGSLFSMAWLPYRIR